MSATSSKTGLAVAALLAGVACTGRNNAIEGPRADGSCRFGTAPAEASSVTVGISDSVVWADAPVPANRGERLVFRQLYETLVDVDCNDRIVTALASAWSANPDSSVWQLTIREGAVFSDGTPVTAGRVADDWNERGVAGPGTDVLLVAGRERTLELTFARPGTDATVLLADRRFAVTLSDSPSRPGTTGFALAESGDGTLVLASRPDRSGETRRISYRTGGAPDQRDLLDQAVDMLVTDRPDVIEYAGELGGYRVVPLPWDRTYFLSLESAGDDTAGMAEFTAALARDALRSGARAHSAPRWWDRGDCPVANREGPVLPALRIGTVSGDRPAREIAERLVFMAGAGGGLPAMLASLRNELTAVTFESRRDMVNEAATDPMAILGSADRFDRDVCAFVNSFSPDNGRTVVPLIDTRNDLILRNGAPEVVVTGDGVPRFEARP